MTLRAVLETMLMCSCTHVKRQQRLKTQSERHARFSMCLTLVNETTSMLFIHTETRIICRFIFKWYFCSVIFTDTSNRQIHIPFWFKCTALLLMHLSKMCQILWHSDSVLYRKFSFYDWIPRFCPRFPHAEIISVRFITKSLCVYINPCWGVL